MIEGERLYAQDETSHTYLSPFPIHFAGNQAGFNELYISSNGTVSFTDESTSNFKNLNLPTQTVNTLVAPYWDDLTVDKNDSDIYVQVLGESPNRRLIVEWWQMKNYRSTGVGTFEIIFYENSPDIRFNYLDTNFSNALFDYGASATIGIQTSREKALEFNFNKPNIRSQSSILFSIE